MNEITKANRKALYQYHVENVELKNKVNQLRIAVKIAAADEACRTGKETTKFDKYLEL